MTLLTHTRRSLLSSVQRSNLITYASNGYIDCGSGSSLDNLQDNAFTVEAWIRATGYGSGNIGTIMSKRGTGGGWNLYVNNTAGLRADLICGTTNAASLSGLDEMTADSYYHHVAMTWDDAGDRKIYLFIDGVPVSSYDTQTAGVGAITSDASNNLRVGSYNGSQFYFAGQIGWSRVSNIVRYTGIFTPNPRCTAPESDANTVLLLRMHEGFSNPQDSSGNGNHGTLTNGVWATCM